MATRSRNAINRLNKYLAVLDEQKLTEAATKHFRDITPYRTGNARRHTYAGQNEIVADYPYAGRLDAGYSNQAPQGMSRPTEAWLKQYIKTQLKP